MTLAASLQRFERYAFRPLAVFATFLMLLLALIQFSGRISLALLEVFEPEINRVLQSLNVQTQGLQGDWRGLNPVIRAQRIEFAAGHAQQVELELDLLESMLRSALIPRRLHADAVEVHVVRDADGWRLRSAGETVIRWQDVETALLDGDDLAARVRLVMTDQRQPEGQAVLDGELAFGLQINNHSGHHRVQLQVANAQQSDHLLIDLWQHDAVTWLDAQQRHLTVSGGLQVPQVLTGMPDLRVNAAGQWAEQAGSGGGDGDVSVQGLQPPLITAPLTLQFGLRGARHDDVVSSVLLAQAEAGDQQLQLQPLHVALDPSSEDAPLRWWSSELALSQITAFLGGISDPERALGRWVAALDVSGRAANVHGYVTTGQQLGFSASLDAVSMQAYKGAPELSNIQGRLWGYGPGMAISLNAADIGVAFPTLYHSGWSVDHAQGFVKAWFNREYLGLRGTHLKARLGDTQVAGGFALSRPPDRFDQRVTLHIGADQADLDTAMSFVPYKIPEDLAAWLADAPRAGRVTDALFTYHGQVRTRAGELARRIDLTAQIHDATVKFDPAWPVARSIDADIHVAGLDTHVSVSRGQMLGVGMNGSQVSVLNNGGYAEVALQADSDAAYALGLVRGSPLAEQFAFITPEWMASGRMNVNGELTIPLKDRKDHPLRVDLQFDVADLSLDMPSYQVELRDVQGSGEFQLPHMLSGSFAGQMFDFPVQITSQADQDWLSFHIEGRLQPEDIYTMLGSPVSELASGDLAFDSLLSIAMTDGVTNLSVNTDLQGLQLRLPAHLAKQAEQSTPSELDIQFLPNYQSVRWQYQDTQGWLHFSESVKRGAMGIGVPPPVSDEQDSAILISGQLGEMDLADWVSLGGDASLNLTLDWEIRGLRVERFVMGEVSFADMVLSGSQRGDVTQFQLAATDLRGDVQLPANQPMLIHLDYLRLPAADGEVVDPLQPVVQQDPLNVEMASSLPTARVVVDELVIGDDPFGAWRFMMTPHDDRLALTEFGADVNGVHIENAQLSWNLINDTSHFDGAVTLDDLSETLPKWDYAANLHTEQAGFDATLSWDGSPAHLGLLSLDGEVDFVARNGRFLDVEAPQGGLRIMSLLNFSNIAKRISFDFSDVVGDGISFREVEAKVGVKQGVLHFREPMKVDSTSSKFEIGGIVNLQTGVLDNEMIVTLPVSASLPWYGVYLALANPLAGLGVIVGQRVLRKPIAQFSSAKFTVGGTLEDPQVKFVGLWNRSISEPSAEQEVETGANPGALEVEQARPLPAQITPNQEANPTYPGVGLEAELGAAEELGGTK